MSQLLAIFGATGQQGGSVANFVLSDPGLSARYKVRGLTRNASNPAAEALRAKGAEVATADLDDPASLRAALAGAHTVFITTETIYDEQLEEREVRRGKAAADAAAAVGAQYIIYSTEVHCATISNAKYAVPAYDSKAEVEAYIRTLPIKSAFFAPGTFMQNLWSEMAPRLVGSAQPGVYAITNIFAANRILPWIDVVADSGKFVGAILAEPEKFATKVVYASSSLYNMDQVAAKISALTGKIVKYVVLPEDEFHAITTMFLFIDEFGYYGPDTERLVQESMTAVPYKLTSLDEFIAANVKLG
ncbi:NmrA-like family domain-containing protein 1 [Madurella mycetomatis]|uniref:NmrA-like family domain-containing protein 1 n=1 Tax=Madurella mycetomatis TaxID=100816 RepID=A0A175W3P8_9PEZI|nr:NmrA-like family domain-containing protein 1 [Madurella mycetomatis]